MIIINEMIITVTDIKRSYVEKQAYRYDLPTNNKIKPKAYNWFFKIEDWQVVDIKLSFNPRYS